MANALYNIAKTELADGTIDLTKLKLMFVGTATATYVFNADHEVVDNGANDTTDPSFCEFVGTGYTGGWTGSGRHLMATGSWSTDDTNDRAELDATDPAVWSGLDTDTASAALVIEERTIDDTNTRLIAYIDTMTGVTFPYVANGSDLTIAINAEGLIHIT